MPEYAETQAVCGCGRGPSVQPEEEEDQDQDAQEGAARLDGHSSMQATRANAA